MTDTHKLNYYEGLFWCLCVLLAPSHTQTHTNTHKLHCKHLFWHEWVHGTTTWCVTLYLYIPINGSTAVICTWFISTDDVVNLNAKWKWDQIPFGLCRCCRPRRRYTHSEILKGGECKWKWKWNEKIAMLRHTNILIFHMWRFFKHIAMGKRCHRATHINELENEIRKPSNYLLLIIMNRSDMAWTMYTMRSKRLPCDHSTKVSTTTKIQREEKNPVNYANWIMVEGFLHYSLYLYSRSN